jgi:hypothetical protein
MCDQLKLRHHSDLHLMNHSIKLNNVQVNFQVFEQEETAAKENIY